MARGTTGFRTRCKFRGAAFKGYVERCLPPVIFARQYVASEGRNVRLFLSIDFLMESGKEELIMSFSGSIVEGTPARIQQKQTLLTARLMDSIFEQVKKPSARWREGDSC